MKHRRRRPINLHDFESIHSRKRDVQIAAVMIYGASLQNDRPKEVEDCVAAARQLCAAVDKSFEAEVQAHQETRQAEIRDRDEKEEKLAKARQDIFGDEYEDE